MITAASAMISIASGQEQLESPPTTGPGPDGHDQSRLVPSFANHLHRASTFFLNWLLAGLTVVFIGLTSTTRSDPEMACRHEWLRASMYVKCAMATTCLSAMPTHCVPKYSDAVSVQGWTMTV
jgi:hypothetical protein